MTSRRSRHPFSATPTIKANQLAPSMQKHPGCLALTSLPEASPAKISPSPVSVPELRLKGPGSGLSSSVALASFDPDMPWLRMSQISLLDLTEPDSGLPPCYGIWPRSGLMRNGIVYPLPTLAPRISGTGSGLLPTPVKADGDRESETYGGGNKTLLGAVRMWPTPSASEPGYDMHTRPPVDKNGDPVTTNQQRWYDPVTGRNVQKGLARAVQMWPTPTTRDHKDTGDCQNVLVNSLLGRAVGPSREHGSLNPTWVEWLQGYPTGWLDLED